MAKKHLRHDMERLGLKLADAGWERLSRDFTTCRHAMGDVILSSARIADRWLFLTEGVVASEQATVGGDALIARFFEPGQFCSNLTSAWSRQLASDELTAVTDVEGVVIPYPLFGHEFLRGGEFGEYLRLKCMETLLFDKDVLCAKTSNCTEVQYRFLEERYAQVIERATQKALRA